MQLELQVFVTVVHDTFFVKRMNLTFQQSFSEEIMIDANLHEAFLQLKQVTHFFLLNSDLDVKFTVLKEPFSINILQPSLQIKMFPLAV
jgi:hypothetical protein